MDRNFARALSAVLKHEDGYVDHPSDPGGATNLGITFAVLQKWRGKPITKADVKALTQDEAAAIYRANYWDRVKGDDLPVGVDYAVFDFAVNSGVSRAAIYLQEIVGVAPDGKIGPLTIKAVEAWDPIKLIDRLCANRIAFLKRLSTWPVFGKGWSSRVSGVLKLAKDMSIAFPAPAPAAPTSSSPQRKTFADWLKGLFIKQAVNHVAQQLKDTPIMSSNLIHNILNVAIALLAGATAFLLATGCTSLATGALDCSASWIDPVWTTGITAALGALKTVINIARDGFGGLFKSQPPVR